MICGLPDPFPDELHYSIVARYCARKQYPSKRFVVEELYGTRNAVAVVDLPSHLDHLISSLPPGHRYTTDTFIDNHTLLPFFAPFLPPERHQRLRADMHGNNGPAIYMRTGLMASRIPSPRWLKLCMACIEADQRCFGECYWHRVHQVPGVEFCPLHTVRLHDSGVSTRTGRTPYEFISADHAVQAEMQQPMTISDRYREPLIRIARDAAWLLGQQHLVPGLDSLRKRYLTSLADHDLATYSGRVHMAELLQAFKDFFPTGLLSLLHIDTETWRDDSWLARLVRAPSGAQHPIHHLLLMHFLGFTAQTFLSSPADRQLFGEGPWPCLNHACDQYMRPVIEDCRIVYSPHTGGRPIGAFSCSCGFAYSRTGPDQSEDDRYRIGSIKRVGPIWESRLRQLWSDPHISLRALAHALGVDPRTAERHAARLGLSFTPATGDDSRPTRASSARELAHGLDQDTRRRIWLAAVHDHPEAGVKAIRRVISPGIYSWLYRNDREWLRQHTPASQRSHDHIARVDWPGRDRQLAEQVKVSAARLRHTSGRLRRITLSAIGNELGQVDVLQQHLDKLPLTAQALRGIVESRDEYAVRRIWRVMDFYQQENASPKRWQLIKRAGVERVADMPRVRQAIDEALQEPATRLAKNGLEARD